MRKISFTGLFNWVKHHKLDVLLLLTLLTISGSVSAVNMTGYPQRFEDEGTYISQAWAIKEQGALTHYTYWYDHPPVGWIQIAAYLIVGQGFERYSSTIMAGREFMLILHLATIGLLYALTRRLHIGKIASFVGVAAYALSPLSIEFSRYVLLDNIALPWLLGALLLALSPRRSLFAAIGAAICMAVAILSKETFLVLLPVVLYCLWHNGDTRNRRYTFAAFGVVFIMTTAAYALYAALKNEFFPGEGHVSLLGTFFWQIFGREGSGSIFDQSSSTHGLVRYWLSIDYLLLAAGAVSLIPALIMRNLRLAGLALLIGLGLLLRTGYTPYPYIIMVLPFAALCFAGALDWLLKAVRMKIWLPFRFFAAVALVELAAVIAFIVVPAWQPKLTTLRTVDADASSRQVVEWSDERIPRGSTMVVESALWADLVQAGHSHKDVIWLYKTETDPAVKKDIGGWKGIDYVVLNGPTIGSPDFKKSFPTVATAIENGDEVAAFGKNNHKVIVYRINN